MVARSRKGACVVYTVYNKGCMLDDRYVGTVPNVSVVHLPNVGKEGHTWLWHIVNHYDSLAERNFPGQSMGTFACWNVAP